MTKVCHLTSGHKRYDGRIVEKECVALVQNGYDVYLVVNDSLEDETYKGVNIISTKFVAKNRIKRMLLSQKYILKKAIEIDAQIYHFHEPELLPVGKKLKDLGKKVIFDSHECYPMQIREKYYIPKLLRRLVARVYYSYETYVCKKLDAVIVPSETNGTNIFEGRSKRAITVNNVPRLEDFYDKYVKIDKSDLKCVCYTGAMTYSRGIVQAIKSAYNAGVKLILAGNIASVEFDKHIKSMPEFSNVDYRGLLKKEEVINVYNDSSIGICTILNIGQYNKGDNLATKVYEYMSMGLPVIATDSVYARKVLKDYEFGILVDPLDVDEISMAIKFLIENKEASEAMGQNGRRAILEKFNWSNEEKKLIELYKSI